MPTTADYLKYADLQMAAEAFLKNPTTGVERYSGTALSAALIEGNGHASLFTATQAAAFAVEWEVLDRRSTIRSR